MEWVETNSRISTDGIKELSRTFDRVTGKAMVTGRNVYTCKAYPITGPHDAHFGDAFSRPLEVVADASKDPYLWESGT